MPIRSVASIMLCISLGRMSTLLILTQTNFNWSSVTGIQICGHGIHEPEICITPNFSAPKQDKRAPQACIPKETLPGRELYRLTLIEWS